MYKQYYTQKQWDEIVNRTPSDPDIKPHCNPDCFHRPGICPYCDGYYRRHPDFVPSLYADEEQKWGGNAAPKLDDQKAAEEAAAWDEWNRQCLLGANRFENLSPFEKKQIHKRAQEIVAKFKEPS